MKEFLKGLELDTETIDTIMAEYGKRINGLREENTTLKNEKKDLEKQVKSDDGIDWKNKYETLDAKVKQEEANKKAQEEDSKLTKRIEGAFGESKFINEYTKKSLINEMKSAIKNPENEGKSDKDIFDLLTKDKEGIFANPNKPVDMPKMENIDNTVTKEMFDKMGYKERLALKQDNPDLFKELNN